MKENIEGSKKKPEEKKHAPFKAKAIIVVPYKTKKTPTEKDITSSGCWTLSTKDDDKEQLNKVGYLSHASNDSELKKDVEESIYDFNFSSNTLMNADINCSVTIKEAFQKEDGSWGKRDKEITFNFTWKDHSFWGKGPKLIVFPLSDLALITIPIILEDSNLAIDNCYKFFSNINDAVGSRKVKDSNEIEPVSIDINGSKKNIIKILDELISPLDDLTPLYTKSFISYVCAYNQEVRNYVAPDNLLKSACKLAWTNDTVGFAIDSHSTSTKMLLNNPGYTRIVAACSPYGTAIVADGETYKYWNRTDQFFWIFLRLVILRFSLLCMLDTISRELAGINIEDLNNKDKRKNLLQKLRDCYLQSNLLKAKFKYAEISDQYDFSRLYDMFYKGLKIDNLYEDVEEKLEAIKEVITIEKDKNNGDIQVFITALVLVLTITSALNDFFDIIEDPYKSIPGIISVAAVIIVMIIFRGRFDDIFGK